MVVFLLLVSLYARAVDHPRVHAISALRSRNWRMHLLINMGKMTRTVGSLVLAKYLVLRRVW